MALCHCGATAKPALAKNSGFLFVRVSAPLRVSDLSSDAAAKRRSNYETREEEAANAKSITISETGKEYINRITLII